MSTWNYVVLEGIRRKAEKAGQTVTLVPNPWEGFPDGVDCFVDGQWTAWFASIEQPPIETPQEAERRLFGIRKSEGGGAGDARRLGPATGMGATDGDQGADDAEGDL